MQKIVKNQEKFQILDGSAAATLPAGTYSLYISADGVNYTKKADVNGNDTLVIANAPEGLFCYIDGIAEGVEITVLL